MAAAEGAAAAILERLEALSCPVVLERSPRDPPAARALLCRPSEPRLALLRWLCAQIYPPISTCLESLPEEAQMKEMAKLGAQLMICRADDLALVEGTAPPEQQLQFFQDLLYAVPPLETPPQTSSPPKVLPFLLELLTTPEGEAALRPPHPPPVPVETSETLPRPRRPLPEVKAELRRLRRGLEELQAQVSDLGEPSTTDPPNLEVLAETFTSLVTAFGAAELCDPLRPPRTPQIHPCGPQAPPVGRGLRELNQVLGTMTQLRASAGELTQLREVTEAIGPQLPPLSRRFPPLGLNHSR